MNNLDYSGLKYSILITQNNEFTFTITVPKLPGCTAYARTKADCIPNAIRAIESHLAPMKRPPLPENLPRIETQYMPSTPKKRVPVAPALADDWLTTAEAARYLRVTVSSLKTMVYRGLVRPYKLGRRNRFRLEELQRLITREIYGANLEAKKRKPLSTLNEALKKIRQLPDDPKLIEKFNKLMRLDEETENRTAAEKINHAKRKKD